jgi:hypothetical protein
MLNGIQGFYIRAYTGSYFLQMATFPNGALLPPGTDVYASIALSEQNNVFLNESPLPAAAAVAWIASWTVYNPDGSQSDPIVTDDSNRNVVGIENCASITFGLFIESCEAVAQVSVFEF